MKSLTDDFISLTAQECANLEAMVRSTTLREGETFESLLEGSTKCMLANKIAGVASAWKKVCVEMYDRTDPSRLPKDAINVVMPYSLAEGRSLYLYGDAGTCKTRAMWYKAAFEFAKTEGAMKIVYIQADEFAVIASNGMYRMESALKLLDDAKTCDLLLMDDIFKGKLNETQELIIFGITNSRMERMKPTIYTSNVSPIDIQKCFTDDGKGNRAKPIIRRIAEVCKVVEFK